MFIFSDSSLCRTRQPDRSHSPGLIATTTSRRFLHRLPVRQRIIYKTSVLVWKCLHDAAPRYLADLCVPAHSVHGRQQMRSTASGTLLVSAASPSMDHEHGTYSLPADLRHQISDAVLETKVLVSRRLEDKKNKVLVLILVLRPRVLVLVLVLR